MKFLRWFLFYIILLCVSFVTFVLYLLGAAYYLTNHEPNSCEMTFMFEYPQYVRVMMEEKIEDQFPRYALYAYGEGVITKRLRKMQFSGIPVLFIPGNAGSHEQVRSLASVSLRKSLNDRTNFHFDYFTVSLGKDYSALYGGILMDEAVYVSHCINKILSLYNGKYNSVAIIGHSMGGIIAKGALLLTQNVKLTAASILITLAAPHRPSTIFDKVFADFYDNIEQLSANLAQSGVTVVSIGGGHRDTLVTSAQTIDYHANITTLSTSIPSVWRSTDHLCILWCKQLILVIVRALFDCVKSSTEGTIQILQNSARNLEAFSYHLTSRYSGKRFGYYRDKMNFGDGVWIEIVERQATWKGSRKFLDNVPSQKNIFLMISLSHQFDNITIDTLNLETRAWIFMCSVSHISSNVQKCDWGWNLTNKTRQTADVEYKLRRTADLSIKEIKDLGMTHIVIQIPPEDRKNVIVYIDVYSEASRVTNVYDANSLYFYLPWRKSLKIVQIQRGDIRHYINFTEIPGAISVELKDLKCIDNVDRTAAALVEVLESWNPTVTQLSFFTRSDDGPKTFKVQQEMMQTNNSFRFRLSLDPACQYTFEIKKANIAERMSVIVRDRWPMLHQIAIALLLLTISLKIDSDRISTVGITGFVVYAAMDVHLECCVMVFLLHIMALSICISVVFLGSVAHNIASRFLARAITFSVTWSEWLIGGLNQVPICRTLIILSIIPATCGALAMVITVFMYYLKLTRMYEDYLEELFMSTIRYLKIIKSKRDCNVNEDTRGRISNHLIIFMLLCFSALPAIPGVLIWAKNFGISTKLESEDPVLLYSWIVIIVCSMMDLIRIPSKITLRSQFLSYFLCLISWIILNLSSTQIVVYHQWWMPPFIALSVVLMSLNSMIP